MSLPPHEFRETLGRFTTGVTIITARGSGTAGDPGERRGMTASAFLSLSLTPPLVGVSVDHRATMLGVLEGSERFGVNVLSVSQRHLSNHFAGRGGQLEQGEDVPWFEHEGLPLISGAVAQLVCRRVQTVVTGDHTLVVGEVEYSRYTDDDPLVYFRGQYHELG